MNVTSQEHIDYLQLYPFLQALDRPLDNRQLRVCCTDGDDYTTDSVVVAAGAGSGKTQVLAARFAWLVITGKAEVDQILTLTFTKKAAAEMYQRIYSVLQKMATDPEAQLTAEQQQRVQKALAHFSSSHIQTLDSYCTYIVRQASNRFGIRPDFTSGSGEISQEIARSALSFVLTNQKRPGIVAIADSGSIQSIAKDVFAPIIEKYTSIISPADFFSSKIAKQCEQIAKYWNQQSEAFEDLQEIAHTIDKTIDDACGKKKGKSELKLQNCAKLLAEATVPSVSLTAEAISTHTLDDQIKSYYQRVKALLTQCKTELTGFKKTSTLELEPATLEFKTSVAALYKDIPFDGAYAYIRHVDDAKDLMSLLDTFMTSINDIKRRTGQLTFADVTDLSLAILQDCEDVRKQEHDMYRRIMIDEFQDNNRKNGELLDALQRPVFFVGDDKQSIYKFRGAEVAVFNDRQEAMQAGRGTVLHMDYNYRSNTELLHAFNQIFGGYVVKDEKALSDISSSKEDKFIKIADEQAFESEQERPWVFPENFTTSLTGQVIDLYKARFTIAATAEKNPEAPVKPEALFCNNNPLQAATPVHAVMYNDFTISKSPDKRDYLEKQKRMAKYVADTILAIKKSCEEQGKAFSYADFAILEKSRTNRGHYTEFLSKVGIPYIVDQQSNLFAEAPINDFYTFMRLCVYSFDVQAFASFLHSPFCGISQQGVEAILCCAIKDQPAKDIQAPALIPFDPQDTPQIQTALQGSDKQKYKRACALFTKYQKAIRSQKLTDTITQLWYDLGYCYNVYWHKDVTVFAEQYDLLFALACQCDQNNTTVTWFIDQLSQLQKTDFGSSNSDLDIKEISYPVESSDAVTIMSIHKSKGLQFKYVFILGCTHNPTSESNDDLYFYTEESGLSVKYIDNHQNLFFNLQKEESNAKNDAEFRRLFYVALTRAEQQAWIIGSWTRPRSDTSKAKSSMLETQFEYYYKQLPDVDLDELEKKGITQTTLTYNPKAPFDFTELYPVLQHSVYASVRGEAPTKKGMLQRIEKLASAFDAIDKNTLVVTPVVIEKRTSPSRLETDDLTEKTATSQDSYGAVNEVIEKTWDADSKTYAFGYNNFGTLAHLFMEMNAQGMDISTYDPPAAFTAHLFDSNKQIICDACRSMVVQFNESAVGKEFAQCKSDFYRAEYTFRTKIEDCYITGSVDLVYKKGNDYVIVDYKTDKGMHPEKYYEQLYCYRKAVAGLLRIEPETIHCTLYYLRHGSAIDVTAAVASMTEEQIRDKIQQTLEQPEAATQDQY